MENEWFAVSNPVAGGGRGARDRGRIATLLREAGLAVELAASEYQGHAMKLATDAARSGFRKFLAIGGDGTLNEMLNGALASGAGEGEAVFGLVPVGRGNDWARTHRIPTRYRDAIAVLARGRKLDHDVGVAEVAVDKRRRFFMNAAGVGFDAHVVERTHSDRLGAVSYLLALPASLLSFRAPELELRFEQQSISGKVFLVFASVNRYCGGGMLVAPRAEFDDGLFDLTVVDQVSLWELLLNLKKLFDGTLPTYRKVRTYRTRWVEMSGPVPVNSEADGELIGATPIRFSLLPRYVKVVVP
ncbi:MAG: diacylglycerol/lipid kinase family protein [Betaproteobacteria bacterium]